MILNLVQSDDFLSDFEQQVDWYVTQNNLEIEDAIEIAERFKSAVEASLNTLARHPSIGRIRFPQFPDLRGTRSWRVDPPFDRFLIYYHADANTLYVDRLIEGHRSLTTDE